MVELLNQFNKNKEEKEQIEQAKQFERDSAVTESAIHPQSVDEQAWQERQSMLSEIRRWLLDLEPKFQRAFEELSGHRVNGEGGLDALPHIKPLCTIDASYHLINYCRIFDHSVMRSNYSEMRINQNLRHGVAYKLISVVKWLAKTGQIDKRKAIMDYLWNYCFNLVEPVYYHALQDGERKHESQIHKVVETKNVLPKEEKKGLFK